MSGPPIKISAAMVRPIAKPPYVGVSVVHGGTPDSGDEEEREDDLDQNPHAEAHVTRQGRCSQIHLLPDVGGKDDSQQNTGHGSAHELADDVGNARAAVGLFCHHEADRDGRIKMTARDVPHGGNHDRENQARGPGQCR